MKKCLFVHFFEMKIFTNILEFERNSIPRDERKNAQKWKNDYVLQSKISAHSDQMDTISSNAD